MSLRARVGILALVPFAALACTAQDSPGTPGDNDTGTTDDTGATGETSPGTDGGSDTNVDPDSPPGKFTDLGFRPKPDGFSFENYGKDAPYKNLTADDMRRLFGDVACSSVTSGCVLT